MARNHRPAPMKRLPKSPGTSEVLSVLLSSSARISSLDVIRVAVQIRAVVDVAQGVKDVRIDSVLDVVHGAVAKDGVDASRMSRAELHRAGPGVPVVQLATWLVPTRICRRNRAPIA